MRCGCNSFNCLSPEYQLSKFSALCMCLAVWRIGGLSPLPPCLRHWMVGCSAWLCLPSWMVLYRLWVRVPWITWDRSRWLSSLRWYVISAAVSPSGLNMMWNLRAVARGDKMHCQYDVYITRLIGSASFSETGWASNWLGWWKGSFAKLSISDVVETLLLDMSTVRGWCQHRYSWQ